MPFLLDKDPFKSLDFRRDRPQDQANGAGYFYQMIAAELLIQDALNTPDTDPRAQIKSLIQAFSKASIMGFTAEALKVVSENLLSEVPQGITSRDDVKKMAMAAELFSDGRLPEKHISLWWSFVNGRKEHPDYGGKALFAMDVAREFAARQLIFAAVESENIGWKVSYRQRGFRELVQCVRGEVHAR